MFDFNSDKTSKIAEHLFRAHSGKISAILTRIFGFRNLELIEDIIQDTFLTAIKVWRMKGEPENPEAWLMLVAKNKILNELNKKKRHIDKIEQLHYENVSDHIDELFLDHEIKDSQLRLLFAFCHPDLEAKTQIMLTLKTLSGFGDKEIANALVMSPSAVRKRIYRAREQLKEKHQNIGIPFLSEASKRTDTVIKIIYLMFNEGYKTTTGNQIINDELCFEAIRLACLLLETKYADKGKIYALLSLMYLSVARFPARIDHKGELIEIEFQDREKWDKNMIYIGLSFLEKSRTSKNMSRYHLESAIASIHCSANTFEQTDWNSILYCYKKLLKIDQSIMMHFNYAIALGWAKGFELALDKLRLLEKEALPQNKSLIYSGIGEFNMKLGNFEIAKLYYQVALELIREGADKVFINKKIAECDLKNNTFN